LLDKALDNARANGGWTITEHEQTFDSLPVRTMIQAESPPYYGSQTKEQAPRDEISRHEQNGGSPRK
jgi:hypothetical protein